MKPLNLLLFRAQQEILIKNTDLSDLKVFVVGNDQVNLYVCRFPTPIIFLVAQLQELP
jgi:hypothetical protein